MEAQGDDEYRLTHEEDSLLLHAAASPNPPVTLVWPGK